MNNKQNKSAETKLTECIHRVQYLNDRHQEAYIYFTCPHCGFETHIHAIYTDTKFPLLRKSLLYETADCKICGGKIDLLHTDRDNPTIEYLYKQETKSAGGKDTCKKEEIKKELIEEVKAKLGLLLLFVLHAYTEANNSLPMPLTAVVLFSLFVCTYVIINKYP